MQRRRLGISDLEVSVLAVGTWAMGGEAEGWGHVDDNESIATIERALELGINLIDTSPSYGGGHSEEIVGKALRDRRDQVVVATKCGVTATRSAGTSNGPRVTCDGILRECEASLRRLQTDHIDLYQCYRPDRETPLAETFAAMHELLDHGKIRMIGLADYGCEEIAAALQRGPVSCVQTPFSLLQRRAAEDLLPFCTGHGVAAIAHSPLAKGLLTGKFNVDSKIRGLRAADSEFLGPRFQRNLERVAQLSTIADRYGKTVSQLSLQWVLRTPGVTSAIVGVKRPSQVEENIGADGWALSTEDLAAIDDLLAGA